MNNLPANIVDAYLSTLIWSETLHDDITIEGETYKAGTSLNDVPGCDSSDMPDDVRESAAEDLEDFRSACLSDIGIDPFKFFDAERVAHDFCLSRNGHGAGFFDGIYNIISQSGTAVRDTNKFNLSRDLQRLAGYAGEHSLNVWVDDNSELKIHG